MKRTATKKILLVQGGLGDSVGPVLEQHGYRVAWVRSAKNALAFFEKDTPALVIIDVPSLKVSAERLCQGIKRLHQDVPVIMIGPEQHVGNSPAAIGGAGSGTSATCADAFMPRPLQQPGEVLTRKFLMQQVWDTSYLGDTRTLDVHIRWLREAIEDDPTDPIYLRTVRRQGYRFENPRVRKG
jgi:DNA-binding response OmpR family regulator